MPGEDATQARGTTNHRLMSPKAGVSVANSVLNAVLGTAALVFIAKNMGPEVMGVLGFSMAAIGMLSFLSDFGVGSIHRMNIKQGEDLGRCVGAYAVIKLALLAVFSVITLVTIEIWRRGYMGGAIYADPAVTDSLEIFLGYYVLLGISQIATHTFDAQDAVAKSNAPAILEIIVRVTFIIFVASSALGTSSLGPVYLAFSYAAGMIAASVLAILLMTKVKISRPDRALLSRYIRSLAPVLLVSVMIFFDLYLDKFVVGYFWGEFEVGLYFGVQKMAVFVGVFSLAIATLILPSVTTYFSRRDIAASWDVVNQAERYVSLIAIPTAAFYLTFGPDILRVFLTREFATAVDTMDVLVISGTLVALVLPLRSAIAAVGSHATLFWVGLGGVAIQLVLMLILVPESILGVDTFGMKAFGAGAALFVTAVYYFFVLRYMAWRAAGIVPNSRSFWHVICALSMIGVMYTIQYLFIPTIDGLALILLAVIGILTYGGVAYAVGELEPSDYRHFRSLLNPHDTVQYAVNELLGKRAH